MRKIRSRPSYFSAPDYIFYLRRHIVIGRSHRNSDAIKDDTIEIPVLSDLLRRLKDDLNYSFISFQEEFVQQQGVLYLLDILRMCQNRQSLPDTQCRPQHLKKISNDEYTCLLGLKYSACHKLALEHLVEHVTALSTLACSILSNFSRTRIVVLELLTECCKRHINGPAKLLEAMSSVKLIFGESVRFKFLISIFNGSGKNSIAFKRVTLTFLNTLLENCNRSADKVRIQCELEEAEFDINSLEKKLHEHKISSNDKLWNEVRKWKDIYLDVQLTIHGYEIKSEENIALKQQINELRNTVKKMEEDKIIFLKTKKELKEKCDHLHQELCILKNSIKHQCVENTEQESMMPPEISREEESGTDSGWFSSDREETKPAIISTEEKINSVIIESPYDCLSWRYPPVPLPQNTVVHRSRSSERKQQRAKEKRSKSENRMTSTDVTNTVIAAITYKHCDGFFYKPNVKFPDKVLTSSKTSEFLKKSPISETLNGLVHQEITRAVQEIGGWL